MAVQEYDEIEVRVEDRFMCTEYVHLNDPRARQQTVGAELSFLRSVRMGRAA